MARFSILLDGRLSPTERLRRQLAGTRVIAADGGIRHARTLDLDVELWVGDFDSTDSDLIACYAHVERHIHPRAKDRTDGEIAVDEALKNQAKEILLVGGFGGQSDHALAHILLALGLAQSGVSAVVSSGDEEAWPLLPGNQELDFPPRTRISIIAFADLTDLTLTGVEWPLTDKFVRQGSSLTLANVVTGPARVTLGSGYGAILAYPG